MIVTVGAIRNTSLLRTTITTSSKRVVRGFLVIPPCFRVEFTKSRSLRLMQRDLELSCSEIWCLVLTWSVWFHRIESLQSECQITTLSFMVIIRLGERKKLAICTYNVLAGKSVLWKIILSLESLLWAFYSSVVKDGNVNRAVSLGRWYYSCNGWWPCRAVSWLSIAVYDLNTVQSITKWVLGRVDDIEVGDNARLSQSRYFDQ